MFYHLLKNLKRRFIRKYRQYLETRAKNKLKKNVGLWDILQKYIKNTSSTGCSYSDYLVLYNYIKQNKPAEVLECGTGVSTIVMAYAMFENEQTHMQKNEVGGVHQRITSMEHHEKWYKVALKNLPENLKQYVEILLSPAIPDYYMIFRGMRYKDIPERPYDFVFIDGPTRSTPDGQKTFNFDFINVVSKSTKPVMGIIDLRMPTYYIMREVFGRQKAQFKEHLSLGFIGPCSKEDLRSTDEIVNDHF